ncbi:MAG: DUF2155 domain-containing protein [Hyphomicrobiales bacterium]|nr:DUF2155 domain-containing protein [Hyphomicrobiales bacterium]
MWAAGALCLVAGLAASTAEAQTTARIENAVAVFAALDKVTARIQRLEVPLNETVKFGALKITPRTCYSRPPTEQPKTTTFVEVAEQQLDGQENRIFSGWMFAESPGLNALEHPVFDIWLTDCAQPKVVSQPARPGAGQGGQGRPGAAPPQGEDDFRRRRPAR